MSGRYTEGRSTGGEYGENVFTQGEDEYTTGGQRDTRRGDESYGAEKGSSQEQSGRRGMGGVDDPGMRGTQSSGGIGSSGNDTYGQRGSGDPMSGSGGTKQRSTRSEGDTGGGLGGEEDPYGGSGQQGQKGDSKIGKFVEKAGGIVGSKGMGEHGHERREKKGSGGPGDY